MTILATNSMHACSGLHMAIFYKSVVSALHDRKKSGRLWLVFICCVFFMATINICCSINFNERAWIDDRNFPGGPLAFFSERQSLPVNVASIATSVITLFLADSLLVSVSMELMMFEPLELLILVRSTAATHCGRTFILLFSSALS